MLNREPNAHDPSRSIIAMNSRIITVAACLAISIAGCGDAREQAAVEHAAQANNAPPPEPLLFPQEPVMEIDPATGKERRRAPIYNELADARPEIDAALERARAANKRVLLECGGNWCIWCYRLHDLFHKDAEVAPVLSENYELVLVDVNRNPEVMKEYDPETKRLGYPWLVVLDSAGQVLVRQETPEFERNSDHDPEKVKAFLERWKSR